jgi:predicted NodU family carbamoyl transferase
VSAILGISTFYHNSAASILKKRQIVAAAQELGEPFRRDTMKKLVKIPGIDKKDMVSQKPL